MRHVGHGSKYQAFSGSDIVGTAAYFCECAVASPCSFNLGLGGTMKLHSGKGQAAYGVQTNSFDSTR
jgi:hypothetical protein